MSTSTHDQFTSRSRGITNHPAAMTALVTGTVGLLLIFPFGVLLGPLALWSGIWAQLRIQRGDGKLRGSGRAVPGIVICSIVSALSASMVLAEAVSLILTGGPNSSPLVRA